MVKKKTLTVPALSRYTASANQNMPVHSLTTLQQPNILLLHPPDWKGEERNTGSRSNIQDD